MLQQPGSMAWIGLYRPAETQLLSAAAQFGLHELAVEDAVTAHQRPKLERYGNTLFVVLRSAHYLEETEEVDFGELHLFVGPNFVLTVRHSQAPDLAAVRRRLEDNPALLRLGPEAVLYAVLDAVVDAYAPVVTGLQTDIDEIEPRCSAGTRKSPDASTNSDRHRLRHELPIHARTALDPGLPLRAAADGRRMRRPIPDIQTPRLAMIAAGAKIPAEL